MAYYAGLHSTDGGNNTGWTFGIPAWKWYAGANSTDGGFNSGWLFTNLSGRLGMLIAIGILDILLEDEL